MPDPKDVFDNPLEYMDFLQSTDFERQQFDWKEVRTDNKSQIDSLKDKVKRCISAFANSSRAGGLLVLGIADDGTIKGTQHVDEQTINNILQVIQNLRNHATQVQDVELPNSDGKRIHLLYTPWTSNAICETVGNFHEAWKRVGAQCLALTEQDRDQLKREKKIVDFEVSYCCPYDPDELDKKVVEEFKKVYLEDKDAQYDYTTEEVLYNIGALMKENDKYAFTNAGFLFFASNPRRLFASAYVRVLRFEVNVEESRTRGVTTFDKRFDGPLPNMIRKLQTFFKDSALFRTIIRRSSHGGFMEDPEYPLFVVDEALINAAIHRDYGATTAIHCIAYQNGLVVENPGGIPQAVPQHFNLGDTFLDSVPRNSRIVDWMCLMKDEREKPLVRALREGTEKMRQEMHKMGLPPPSYETTFTKTSVTLYNLLEERLEPHIHTKSTRNNEPSTSSALDDMGKSSSFIGWSPAQTGDSKNKVNNGLSDLPNGWEWTTLQEACSTPQYGWTTKATAEGTLRLLRTTDITDGNVDWETVPFCTEEPPDKEKYLLKTGDIVISRAGSVGYSYLVKSPQNAVFASYLIRFKPLSMIDENYLRFFLKSPDYWKIISKEKAGIALVNVNATKLKRIEIPLPPLAEQHRIVAKLEVLFTQLDAAVDNLKKAQTQLQRYRQSLLKSAFEGELTKEWREGYSGELESMSVSEVSTMGSLPDLPDGWVWTKIKDIAEFIRGVSYRKDQSSKTPKDNYVPILRANNINAQLNYEDLVYVQRERIKDEQFVKALDIIIAMSSGSKHLVGKAAQAYQDFEGGFGTFCGLVRVSEEVNQKFIGLFFQSPGYRNEISRLSIGININNLRRENIEEMLIPVPPLAEQEQIVSELKRHLSVADEIEATIGAELTRAERLRQSILKDAFSGKFVPQDPKDEPASVLLEKIREEKEDRQPQRKKTKTKVKRTSSAQQLSLPLD